MTDRELMQQAFDAMSYGNTDEREAVRIALRDRLAQPEQESFSPEAIRATQAAWKMGYDAAKAEQPEQEPVAYIEHHKGGDNLVWDDPGGKRSPLYTAPPQRKPLKLREIEKCIYDANNDPIVACRNVEAKLKERNT